MSEKILVTDVKKKHDIRMARAAKAWPRNDGSNLNVSRKVAGVSYHVHFGVEAYDAIPPHPDPDFGAKVRRAMRSGVLNVLVPGAMSDAQILARADRLLAKRNGQSVLSIRQDPEASRAFHALLSSA